MNKLSSIIASLLIVILIIFCVTTEKTSMSIDDLAYALAMGIDKGDKNTLSLSLQFSKPTSGKDSSSSSSPSFIYSVECSSISSRLKFNK